ncbi:MAG: helix-turn-helix transcriptional regulator [Eubacteriales bacterium]|nr:helix-turn-helix transcriptional regulator [Eubacteriales bacterium]
MSDSVETTIGMCLREARKAAGYCNAGQAAIQVSLSPETVGRHERGTAKLLPEDAIHYASIYGRPDILIRYCDDCPVHEALYGNTRIRDRDLPWNAMRISSRLRKSAYYAERLEAILDDGVIDDDELPELEDILSFLQDLDIARREMLAVSMSLGIIHDTKKAAPTGMGATERAKTTHSKADQMAHAYCTTICMSVSK